MELDEAIAGRRSIRRYTQDAVSDDERTGNFYDRASIHHALSLSKAQPEARLHGLPDSMSEPTACSTNFLIRAMPRPVLPVAPGIGMIAGSVFSR